MLFEYETERLILKILRPDSAAQVLDFYLRDRELFERVEPDRMPGFYTVLHQQNVLKCEYNLAFKLSTVRFYVFRKEDPQTIIGTVCFHDIEKGCYQSCNVGYKFSSAVHHQGYATEALGFGIRIIFHELGLHRIEAWVLPDNRPSIQLLTRLGFDQVGILRSCLHIQGKWRDHILFSLPAFVE